MEGGGDSGMSKNLWYLLLFRPSRDLGCGLQDVYISLLLMYALERFSTPPKPMLFHRFSMVPGNAPGRQNPGGALTINSWGMSPARLIILRRSSGIPGPSKCPESDPKVARKGSTGRAKTISFPCVFVQSTSLRCPGSGPKSERGLDQNRLPPSAESPIEPALPGEKPIGIP